MQSATTLKPFQFQTPLTVYAQTLSKGLGKAKKPAIWLTTRKYTPPSFHYVADMLCWAIMPRAQNITVSLFAALLVWGAGVGLSSSSPLTNKITAKAPSSLTASHSDGQPQGKPTCKCRANGHKFNLGETTCFNSPKGIVRARCILVLNNTSWEILGEGCESAANQSRKIIYAQTKSNRQLSLR